MNQPVDPVAPEVACRSADRSMSALLDNFLQLAHSLQNHGIVCEEAVPELYGSKNQTHPREVRSALAADEPGALSRPSPRSTREEASQLLHTVLSQATEGLQRSLLKGTNGHLKPTSFHGRSSGPHICPAREPTAVWGPASRASALALACCSAYVHGDGHSPMISQAHSDADASNIRHANVKESTPLQQSRALQESQCRSVPVLLVLDTPFSENIGKTAHTSFGRRASSTSQYIHHDGLDMLDITRKSIERDKQRKSGASMLMPHVHVEQGCSYLGVQTWGGTVPHHPANLNLVHGYRNKDTAHAHSISLSHASTATWVPGGKHKQTFNKVAAEQAHVGVAQKTSTGCAVLAPLLPALQEQHPYKMQAPRLLMEMHSPCRCFSDAGVLRPGPLAKRHDFRYATSTSPQSLHLPSASDALRGQPRCHRAFLASTKQHATTSSLSMHSCRAPPVSASHLDLTCPRDRLNYDLLVSRSEQLPRKHVWDATRRTITSSTSTVGRVRPASAYTLRSKTQNQCSGSGTQRRHPQGASRWDPCSSLDASCLGHLRSCNQDASFDATGRVEFHSHCDDTDDTQASIHSGDISSSADAGGNVVETTVHSNTNEHKDERLIHNDARTSAEENCCSSDAQEDLRSESSGNAEILYPSSFVDHQPSQSGQHETGVDASEQASSLVSYSRNQDAASALLSGDGSMHSQRFVVRFLHNIDSCITVLFHFFPERGHYVCAECQRKSNIRRWPSKQPRS